MAQYTRRRFLFLTTASLFISRTDPSGTVMTVTGPVESKYLGTALTHEHVLVDFIGAEKTSLSRWNREKVAKKALPYFIEAKKSGVHSVFECTPAFLGRDPELLQMISRQTGVLLITNTGYYGAGNNKYLPAWAFTESSQQLADRWIREFDNGIASTGIRPGFIKISVDAAPAGLSDLHKKIVRAAALTHKRTGLTIHSHTGPANAAFEQIEILKKEGVAANAFVWVHAQEEPAYSTLVKAAQTGAWVSLDHISHDFDKYVERLTLLKEHRLLNRVLISHDAGWYHPDEADGGEYTGYTDIFRQLIPLLETKGFTKDDIDQLLVKNPAEAMTLRVREAGTGQLQHGRRS